MAGLFLRLAQPQIPVPQCRQVFCFFCSFTTLGDFRGGYWGDVIAMLNASNRIMAVARCGDASRIPCGNARLKALPT